MKTYDSYKVQQLMMFFDTEDIDVAVERCTELFEALGQLSASVRNLEERELS